MAAEIGDLKKISEVKQEMENLVKEKDEAINSKNKEIKALKVKVKEKEAEKMVLETRFQESEHLNFINLAKEVDELKQAKGNLEGKNLVLEAEIKRLEAEIKRLEAEIKHWKDQVKELKAEKEDLQKRLNDLEKKHSFMNQQIAELDGSKLLLDEKVDHLSEQNKNLKEDSRDLKKDIRDLKQDVGDLKKENRELKRDLEMANGEIKQLKSDDKGPLLLLGEMCFQIPSLIYQKVIPQWHDESINYNIQDLEDDINALRLEQDAESQILAQKNWDVLREKLKWEEKHARNLKKVRYTRNITAHPPIDGESLRKAAIEAKKNGMIKNHTYDIIMELISIWEKLKI